MNMTLGIRADSLRRENKFIYLQNSESGEYKSCHSLSTYISRSITPTSIRFLRLHICKYLPMHGYRRNDAKPILHVRMSHIISICYTNRWY